LAAAEDQRTVRVPQPGAAANAGAHPLDAALAIARDGLRNMQENIRDYTATLIKQERVNGELNDIQYLYVKVRHEQSAGGRVVVPFSVYVKYLKPEAIAGREAIWIEGRNDGKLVAHETGFKNLLRLKLDPAGYVAMSGNRYPITKIGMLQLVQQLIEKGERDRLQGLCEVKFYDNAKVDGRECRRIQVTHPERKPEFDFHRAEIFIDRQLNIPIRYAAWSWPPRPGDPAVLEEVYTYRDVRLNVGLSDKDFDPDCPDYQFP
jgi:hypothetical protein